MYRELIASKLKNGDGFKIVFLGDSITSAEWVHPNYREIIEYVLKQELEKDLGDWKLPSWGIRCINSGFDGSTSRDWLNKLQTEVLNYNPDMVIVMGTINDMDMGISSDESNQNIKKILETLKAKVKNVIYSTDIAPNNESYRRKYEEYVGNAWGSFNVENALFINLYEEYKKFDLSKLFTFISEGNSAVGINPGDVDYIHPNQLGNAYIAKVLLDKVFGIQFDPEKYIRGNNSGEMFPAY